MKIEIWSDVVCPWCYIGKRRLEKALERFPGRAQVEVVYRSFQLDPSAPTDSDETVAEMLGRRYGGGVENARRMMAHVSGIAAEEGLEFHLDRTRVENTRDAHRLLHLAKERGVQVALEERLFRAYFTEGQRVGRPEVLVKLAVEVGLDEAEVRSVLEDASRYADAVQADQRAAQALGVRGVPFFVVDGRYGVSGAQPGEVFREVLERAAPGLVPIAGDAWAEACGPDGCEVPPPRG